MSERSQRIKPEDIWPEEWVRTFRLTPAERWRESEKRWVIYLANGGSLAPEPDPQSPFYETLLEYGEYDE